VLVASGRLERGVRNDQVARLELLVLHDVAGDVLGRHVGNHHTQLQGPGTGSPTVPPMPSWV
jgi:hypothetical protein